MNIPLLVFYFNAFVLVASSIMVITQRNPVRGALFLVLAFFCSAILWMLMEAEFLSLLLIFVYVGAVMTLFLFVVMMINIDLVPEREGFVRYLPFGAILMVIMVGLMLYVIKPVHFKLASAAPVSHPANYSNVKELGEVLYTQYMYPFEIAAIILVVAIVAAISLAFRGRKANTKSQKMSEQHAVRAKDRFYLVDLDRSGS